MRWTSSPGGRERPAPATAGSQILARYAGLSGGASFAVSDFTALKKAADRIASELIDAIVEISTR